MIQDFVAKVFVSALLHDGNGKVMMAKRGGQARDRHGEWEFGGGSLEAGETLTQALVRETKEELGVELIDIHQLHTYDFARESGTWIGVFYVCQVDPSEVVISEPVYDEIGWFFPDELPEPTLQVTRELVQKAKPFLEDKK